MKYATAIVTIVAVGMWALSQSGADAQNSVESRQATPLANTRAPTAKASFWMQQKLRLSEQLLGGLASGDFDKIGEAADVLKGLNMLESFVRRKPASYGTQLKLFQFAVEELQRSAQDDNLAGATLAFNQLTISCVNCHKHMRRGQ